MLPSPFLTVAGLSEAADSQGGAAGFHMGWRTRNLPLPTQPRALPPAPRVMVAGGEGRVALLLTYVHLEIFFQTSHVYL